MALLPIPPVLGARVMAAPAAFVLGALLLAAALGAGAARLHAQQPAAVEFSAEFLEDPAVIVHGREVFMRRCAFCHVPMGHLGGHAPQLRPNALTAEFVFARITLGFQFMPPWGTLLHLDDRRALVAYILSDPRRY